MTTSEIFIDVVITGQCQRFVVSQTDGPHREFWYATSLNRQPDGTWVRPCQGHVCRSKQPGEALGRAVGWYVDRYRLIPGTELRSTAVICPARQGRSDAALSVIAAESSATERIPAAFGAIIDPRERSKAMTTAIESALERLSDQLARGYSDGFKQFLTFMSRFHQYSWNNALLIQLQRPNATIVGGLRHWNQMGYQVRKGESGIFIWCPVMRTVIDDAIGDDVERLVGFKPGTVFDVSQLANLDEKPLPNPFPPLPDDMEALFQEVKDRVERAGIRVETAILPPGVQAHPKADGSCSRQGRTRAGGP